LAPPPPPPPPPPRRQILPFLESAVEARAEIAPALAGNRDLLYLDVALENSIRAAAERGVGSAGGEVWAYLKNGSSNDWNSHLNCSAMLHWGVVLNGAVWHQREPGAAV